MLEGKSYQGAAVLKPPISVRHFFERRFLCPVVMVAASDCAEVAVRKNGLSVTQLLRPFTSLESEAVLRLGDKLEMVTISNFGCRLFTPETLFEVPHDQRSVHFKHVLLEAQSAEQEKGRELDSVVSRICQPPHFAEDGEGASQCVIPPGHSLLDMDPDVERNMKNQTAEQFEEKYMSLYDTFARDYISLIRCSYFDTLDHPVCHFHVVCTSGAENDEPIPLGTPTALSALTSKVLKKLEAVSERAHSVRSNNPSMSQEVLRFVLVIHDDSRESPTLENSKKIFDSIRNAQTGTPCAFIVINSNKPAKVLAGAPVASAVSQPSAVDPDDPLGGRSFTKTSSPPPEVSSGVVVCSPVIVPQLDPMMWVHANEMIDNYLSDSTKGVLPRVTYFQSSDQEGKGEDSKQSRLLTCAYLSRQDVGSIREMMQSFLRTKLIQHLCQRHQALTAFVQEHRQTGLSKVAAWFRSSDTKPKLPTFISGKNGMPSVYAAGSLEMSMRRLGDYSMFLRDFDTAANMFKYVRDELVGYISSREFNAPVVAAANEGIGLALFFQGRLQLPNPAKPGECRLEAARDEYVKHRTFSYGLRCSLCMYLFCRGRSLKPANDRSKFVASTVTSTAEIMHNRVIAAFMREIEALSALFHASQEPTTRRTLRKVARLMALAAGDYAHTGQYQMALKCLLRAQHINRLHGVNGKSWCGIYDHIIAETATMHLRIGNNVKAIALFSTAVSAGSSIFCLSPTVAAGNVKNFISQLRSLHLPNGIIPHLQLPNVVIAKFTTYEARYNPDTVSKLEERMLGGTTALREWQSMEEPLKQHYSTNTLFLVPRMPKNLAQTSGTTTVTATQTRSRGLSIAAGGGNSALNENVSHRAGAGETLKIEVSFTNPVCLDLELTDVCLCYINITDYDEVNKDVQPAKRPPPTVLYGPAVTSIALPASPAGPPSESASHCQLSTVSVELPFVETNRSFFKIVGVAWSVMGVRGRFLLSTVESEAGKAETAFEYAVQHPDPPRHCDQYLTVHVSEPEARLSMSLDPPLPEVLRDGAVHRCVLSITNHSTHVEASSLALLRNPCTAHWLYFEDFSFQDNENQDVPFVFSGSEKEDDDTILTSDGALKVNVSEPTYQKSVGGRHSCVTRISDKIGAGETLCLKVTVRAAADGGGLGGVPSVGLGGGSTKHHDLGTAFHVALMLGYFPGDGSSELSSPLTPLSPTSSRNKFVRLHTLLRRVHLVGSVAAATAIAPVASIPKGLSLKSKCEAIPMAAGSLLITNRTDGVGAPIDVVHVSCIHSFAWEVRARFGVTRAAQEAATNSLADADGASLHTTSDQGVSISFEVSRVPPQAPPQLVADCEGDLGVGLHGQSLETLFEHIVLPENSRLKESVLLDRRQANVGDVVHFCGGVRCPSSSVEKGQFLDAMFTATPTGKDASPTMESTTVPPPLWYAITHGLPTTGRTFGEVPPTNMDDFAFYVDRGATGTGAKRHKTNRNKGEGSLVDAEQRRVLETVYLQNVSRFGQVPTQFAPICFVVTWSSMENGATVFGQTYHLVDVLYQMSLAASCVSRDSLRQVMSDRIEPILGRVVPPVLLTGSSSTRTNVPTGSFNELSGLSSTSQLVAARSHVVIEAFRKGRSAAVYPLSSITLLNSAAIEPFTPAGSIAVAPNILPVSHAVLSIRAKYRRSVTLPVGSVLTLGEVEVPVDVIICNHSSLPVKLTIIAQAKGYSPNQLSNSYFSAAVTYSGTTSFKVVVLPDEHIVLPLTALLSACGNFNLNTMRVAVPQLIPFTPGIRTGFLPADANMFGGGDDELALVRVEVTGLDAVWPLKVSRAATSGALPAMADCGRRHDAPVQVLKSVDGAGVEKDVVDAAAVAPFTSSALPTGMGYSPWWGPYSSADAFGGAAPSPFFSNEEHYSTCQRGCSVVAAKPPLLKRNGHQLPTETNSVMESSFSPSSPVRRNPLLRGSTSPVQANSFASEPPTKVNVATGVRARTLDSSSESEGDVPLRVRARSNNVGSVKVAAQHAPLLPQAAPEAVERRTTLEPKTQAEEAGNVNYQGSPSDPPPPVTPGNEEGPESTSSDGDDAAQGESERAARGSRRASSAAVSVPPMPMETDEEKPETHKKASTLDSDIDSDDELLLTKTRREKELIDAAATHADPNDSPPLAPRGTIGPDDSDDL